jgi:uncharacterized protein
VRRNAVAFLSGTLFAAGLGLAGMTQPARVVGFLDFLGRWDPTLAFVMAGALLVMFAAHRFTRRLGKPLLAASFPQAPPARIDSRLVFGSAIFGLGWGLGGYCPGPGIVSLGAGASRAFAFVAAMSAGMLLFQRLFAFPATLPRATPLADATAGDQ